MVERTGVMDARYAAGRRTAAHLKWRYQVRATFAVRAFRTRVPNREAPAVLELGAAEGLTLLQLRELLGPEGRYDGVELSDELLEQAPALPDGVRLHRGDICALPPEIEAGRYHLCTALALLEHLKDPAACLREAYRALRPGGLLVASCPHPFWDEIAGKLRMVADEHHETHMNEATMRSMATDAGFVDVEFAPFMWAPIGFLPYLRLSLSPQRALDVDERIHRLRLLDASFVNQGLIARKPSPE